MDPAKREKIVREHGPHVSSMGIPAKILNTVNIKHILPPKKSPTKVHFKGAHSVEDSGPPSPTSGPILNFGEIAPKIYRSSFPQASNLADLKALGLKTMITLVNTPFDNQIIDYLKEANIKHYRILIPAHKNGNTIPMDSIAQVIRLVTNLLNHPILVHCNKGKHRTGCITAALRKLANHQSITPWMHPQYLSEYHQYAHPKPRVADELFIRDFSAKQLLTAIETIETSNIGVAPIDYTTDLPTPPSSEASEAGEIGVSYCRDISPVGTFDGAGHGALCECGENGACPFQLEHERAEMGGLHATVGEGM